MSLEQTLTSRDSINGQLRGVLDEATGKWGIRVARVELKSIDPPPSIQDSMEKQMRADRDKRAIILTAEGQRTAAITTAEGQKQAAVLSAEGQKQAAILSAEGERQSAILRAEGERAARFLQAQGQAKAIEKVFAAVKNGKPTPELLAYQYLQTLPQLAQGDSNKVWMIPSGFDKALEQFARMFGEKGEDGVVPVRRPAPTIDDEDRRTPLGEMDDDVKDWFEGDSSADLAEADKLRTAQATAQAAAEIEAAQLVPVRSPTHVPPRSPNIEPAGAAAAAAGSAHRRVQYPAARCVPAGPPGPGRSGSRVRRRVTRPRSAAAASSTASTRRSRASSRPAERALQQPRPSASCATVAAVADDANVAAAHDGRGWPHGPSRRAAHVTRRRSRIRYRHRPTIAAPRRTAPSQARATDAIKGDAMRGKRTALAAGMISLILVSTACSARLDVDDAPRPAHPAATATGTRVGRCRRFGQGLDEHRLRAGADQPGLHPDRRRRRSRRRCC